MMPLLATALAGSGLVAYNSVARVGAASAQGIKKVVIKESNERYRYAPTKVTVMKGTTVTWRNMTDVEHNITAKGAVKIDKDIEDGKSASGSLLKEEGRE
jgi:plastocyanin